MKVYYGYVHVVDFPCSSLGVPNGSPTGSSNNTASSAGYSFGESIFDKTIQDVYADYTYLSTDPDFPSVGNAPSSLGMKLFAATYTAYDAANEQLNTSGQISIPAAKYVISTSTDNQSAWGPPYDYPFGVCARMAENQFCVGLNDVNNSLPGRRMYLQMVKAT